MNMKKVSSSIGLFFLTAVFFAQAMEEAGEKKEDEKNKTGKSDVVIDLRDLGHVKRKNNNLTVSSRTDRRANSSGEKQHTPRNFDELSELVRAKSVFAKPSEEEEAAEKQTSILRRRKKKSEEDSGVSGAMEIDMQELKDKRDQYLKSKIEEIKNEVYIGPEVMAEGALRVHHTKKKNPIATEREGYA